MAPGRAAAYRIRHDTPGGITLMTDFAARAGAMMPGR